MFIKTPFCKLQTHFICISLYIYTYITAISFMCEQKKEQIKQRHRKRQIQRLTQIILQMSQ